MYASDARPSTVSVRFGWELWAGSDVRDMSDLAGGGEGRTLAESESGSVSSVCRLSRRARLALDLGRPVCLVLNRTVYSVRDDATHACPSPRPPPPPPGRARPAPA